MDVLQTDDYDALSLAAADIVADTIAAKPDAAVVLATGDTPVGMFRELAARRERGELDLTRIHVFQLDEYLGIGPDDRRSLLGWMRRSFLGPLALPDESLTTLPGDADDPHAACQDYADAVVAAGGYDLAVLGLGPNGHLGYNEPPSDPLSPTRVVDLTPESIESAAYYWGSTDQVPPQALTAGMDLLLAAKRILLLVSGPHKRTILRRSVMEPPSPAVPASYLQGIEGVTIIADRAAWPDGE